MIRSGSGSLVLAAILLTGCANYTEITKDPVEIAKYRSNTQAQVFTVKGCVRHPGKWLVKKGEIVTLFEALQKAGGTINGDYFAGERAASLSSIRVLRVVDGKVVAFKLNVNPGKAGRNFPIKAGDLIYVPELI